MSSKQKVLGYLASSVSLFLLTATLTTSFNATADVAEYIAVAPTIDGNLEHNEWQQGTWYHFDQNLIGELPEPADFSAKYTLRWDADYLYILVRVNDDILYDQHPNPLYLYWDDDCLEIFIDEDASGGIHQFDYNAFAYHIGLDNQSVDIGPEREQGKTNFVLLNDHITSAWKRDSDAPHTITWEVALRVFDDSFNETQVKNTPVSLHPDKEMGFMLAYCDNDGSPNRESFIGSHPIKPINGDKNLGYIDASVFDSVVLKMASTKKVK